MGANLVLPTVIKDKHPNPLFNYPQSCVAGDRHSTAKQLNDYVKKYQPKKYLFNGANSIQYSVSSCQKIIKKYLGKEHTFHKLRHTHATKSLDAGNDLHSVANQLGHSSIKTTEIYLHVTKQRLLKRKHVA